ncbi:MAG: ABC transporter permease, partial [Pseudomonadota bacterium]
MTSIAPDVTDPRPASPSAPPTAPGAGPRRKRLRALREANWLIKLCIAMLVLLVAIALLAPLIAPHDPNAQSLLARLRPPYGFERYREGYWLGTDELGRDILSRLLYGLRFTFLIALVGSVISLLIGTTIGIVAGYLGGWVDSVLMAIVDVQIAFPFTLMALLAAAVFGNDLTIFIIVVGLAGWDNYARVVRGQVLSLREAPFIASAKVVGASPARIVGVHMLPNIASPIIVLWTFGISNVILLESSLSFLGLGVQPPTATLGSMTGFGRDYLASYPHIGVAPAMLILIIALVLLLLGDWLRDTLDVRLKRQA